MLPWWAQRSWLTLAASTGLLLVSCSKSEGIDDAASGGAGGTGGSAPDGGAVVDGGGWPSGGNGGSAGQGGSALGGNAGTSAAGGSAGSSAQGGSGGSGGSGGTPPACSKGVEVSGSCWFLGDWGQSCTQVCSAQGGSYDDATRTYAGSDGSDANCTSVLSALNVQPAQFSYDNDCSYGAVGCGLRDNGGGYFWRRCGNSTTADANDGSTQRACACKL